MQTRKQKKIDQRLAQNTIQVIQMGSFMVINHFNQWNIQIQQEGWDIVLEIMKKDINPEKDEYFDIVTEWMQQNGKKIIKSFLITRRRTRNEITYGSFDGLAQKKKMGQQTCLKNPKSWIL
ncbi:unnamed protein product [Paramecium sonneborni]|uniref:Uncharacterized protein n=1 Tax=Paramecium sonneborni TaxID=65129 RepID=A0A8S1QKR1_9CILI|nr:unnamed protein product [Paramecium sonneborni]